MNGIPFFISFFTFSFILYLLIPTWLCFWFYCVCHTLKKRTSQGWADFSIGHSTSDLPVSLLVIGFNLDSFFFQKRILSWFCVGPPLILYHSYHILIYFKPILRYSISFSKLLGETVFPLSIDPLYSFILHHFMSWVRVWRQCGSNVAPSWREWVKLVWMWVRVWC